ncbi:hypothetical protein OROMI_012999 [Orobanche minor]
MVFKIRPSQEINKIRDGTLLEAGEILTYRKKPRNGSVWHFSSKLDVPINVLQKKRVARILVFKIRPSQEINKIRDGTLLEAEEILTYRKNPRNGSMSLVMYYRRKEWHGFWFSKLGHLKKLPKFVMVRTPLEAEEILTFRKKPRNGSVWHFSSKLDVPSNVLQKKRVAQILVFKIRPSQEILKIRDGTPSEAEEILTYRKKPSKWKRVARIMVFKIRPFQEILKIRDGTPLDAEEILTYIKKPSKQIVWHFSSKLDVPSNILQKKRVARILFFKIWPSQEILKIRYVMYYRRKELHRFKFSKLGHLKKLTKFVMVPPLEAEKILTYRKKPRNGSVWHFSSKLDVPSNVLQKKRVAQILVFKIRPSQEILKIRDGTPSEAEEILTYRKKHSKW